MANTTGIPARRACHGCLAAMLVLLSPALFVAGSLRAAEDVPLGHRDFRPSPSHPVGFRGDGSGAFPGATPPTAFSDGTSWQWADEPDPRQSGRMRRVARFTRDPANASNIRWSTPLPSWSNSSPIVVGGRVLVMSEPTNYAPILLCLDAANGKVLWQREVDHLDVVPGTPQEIAQVKKDWGDYHVLKRTLTRLAAEKRSLDRRLAAAPEDAASKKELEEWTVRAKAAKADNMDLKSDIGGLNNRMPDAVPVATLNRLTQLATKYGCHFLQWEANVSKEGVRGSAYTGSGHATPASDGRHVYVFTGYNCAACYDRDGTTKWMRWLGPWQRARGGGWMDFTQSPVLVDGRLIVATKKVLTALDAATGERVWQATMADEHLALTHGYDCLLLTGAPLRIGGTACFLWFDGLVYRARDGKVLTGRIFGTQNLYFCCCPVVKDDVVCFVGRPDGERGRTPYQMTAVKLRLADADRLEPTVLWSEPHDARGLPRNGVIWDGRLYVPLGGRPQTGAALGPQDKEKVFDIATGRAAGETCMSADHLSGVLLAGKHLVTFESLHGGQCRARFHDLEGKMVSENYLSSAPASGAKLDWIRSETGRDGWHDGFYHGSFHAVPFFQGDRIYIRSRDELICVGPPVSPASSTSKPASQPPPRPG